jgi:hypothetical protein
MKVRPKIGKLKLQDNRVLKKDRTGSPDSFRAVKKIVLLMAVFLWPAAYLFRNVFIINGKYSAIINDFIPFYYKYKHYLLASFAEFRFPLWSPSEAAGFPFYTNPFAQMFYPLNVLLVIWYKIMGGYNPFDYQIFTVLGISIFSLGLFIWLKLTNKNIRAVLFASLVMGISFKVTEIIRFPNAVHTAAWYPWVLYAITQIFLSSSLKKAALYGLLLTFSLVCICTGGYPYYLYYGPFLFAPYLMFFFIRPLRRRLIGLQEIAWKRALLTLVLSGIIAAVLCGPYLLGIKQLMEQTADRGGKDFAYSTYHSFGFVDTVGSLIYPPASNTEGWYFFSITALLIISVYIFSKREKIRDSIKNNDTDRPATTNDLATKLLFLVWIAIISYITYGSNSYLFKFMWNYFPGFSALRAWGRLNIILVPILAWLLSLGYAYFESVILGKIDASSNEKRSTVLWPIATLVAAYAVVLAAQLYMYYNGIFDNYWTEYFKELTPLRIKFITHGAVGFACILLFMIFAGRIRSVLLRYPAMILIILLSAAVFEMRHTAIHIWTKNKEWYPQRFKLDIAKINELSFANKRMDYNFTICLDPVFSAGIVENWYFTRYIRFLKEHQNEPEELKIIKGVTDGRKIFFAESIGYLTIREFLNDSNRFKNTGKLVLYTGDELNWEIDAPVSGYFSFIDNWAPGWKAWVDGQPADIKLLFGTFKSVYLTAGKHTVRFVYQPKIFETFKKRKDF